MQVYGCSIYSNQPLGTYSLPLGLATTFLNERLLVYSRPKEDLSHIA